MWLRILGFLFNQGEFADAGQLSYEHQSVLPCVTNCFISSAMPGKIFLSNPTRLPNRAIQFSFTNSPGITFTALTATNASSAPGNWQSLGNPIETTPGQYRFTDPQATNAPRRFYQIRWPQ